MTSTTASERGAPSLQDLRKRQQEAKRNLPQLDSWIQSKAPWLQLALASWVGQLLEDKEYLVGFAEQAAEKVAEAERHAAKLGEKLDDAAAKEQQYEADVRRRETERDQAHERVAELQAEVEKLQAGLRDAERARDAAKRKLEALNGKASAPTVPKGVDRPAPVAPSSSPPRAAEEVAAAFVAWCRTGGALASRLPQFAEHVRAVLPHASVAAVYRDLDSPARPVVFARSQQGGAPAEYWLVEGEGCRLLLPQPQGPHQFRDLAPVFEGSVAPKDLTAVRPALVRPVGGGFEVAQAGAVA